MFSKGNNSVEIGDECRETNILQLPHSKYHNKTIPSQVTRPAPFKVSRTLPSILRTIHSKIDFPTNEESKITSIFTHIDYYNASLLQTISTFFTATISVINSSSQLSILLIGPRCLENHVITNTNVNSYNTGESQNKCWMLYGHIRTNTCNTWSPWRINLMEQTIQADWKCCNLRDNNIHCLRALSIFILNLTQNSCKSTKWY